MANVGDVKWDARYTTKGELPSEALAYSDGNLPFSASIVFAVFGLFSGLLPAMIGGIALVISKNDYDDNAIQDEILSLLDSLKGKSDSTRIKVEHRFRVVRKGSQGLFWVPTGDVRYSRA